MSLRNVTCADLTREKRELAFVQASDTVAHAMGVMATKGVQSLPVVEYGKFIGVLDVMDVLSYVVYGNFKYDKTPAEEDLSGSKLEQHCVNDIVGINTELQSRIWNDGLTVVGGTESIADVLDKLCINNARVLVNLSSDSQFKPGGPSASKNYRILSQSDVLKFISTSSALDVISVEALTVDQSHLLNNDQFNELCTVKGTVSTLDAFRRMISGNADAVAVVDNEEKLVDTLSASDLRTVFSKQNDLRSMLSPVADFIKTARNAAGAVAVTKEDSIKKAIDLVVFHHIHRVWVVSEAGAPLGCIRIQDLLIKFSRVDYFNE